jgi:hypothetical protein
MCKVVNIYQEKYDVYIGRAGRGGKGFFGNPILRNKKCRLCNELHVEQGSTLSCYKRYLDRRLEVDEEFRECVKQLKGKVLGCFCPPKPCHGDILIRACLELWE